MNKSCLRYHVEVKYFMFTSNNYKSPYSLLNNKNHCMVLIICIAAVNGFTLQCTS